MQHTLTHQDMWTVCCVSGSVGTGEHSRRQCWVQRLRAQLWHPAVSTTVSVLPLSIWMCQILCNNNWILCCHVQATCQIQSSHNNPQCSVGFVQPVPREKPTTGFCQGESTFHDYSWDTGTHLPYSYLQHTFLNCSSSSGIKRSLCPCLWCVLGVSLSQRAVQASVQQWSRCSGWRLLGSVLPVWWPQWEDPGGHWLRGLPQTGGAAHVSNWQVYIVGEQSFPYSLCSGSQPLTAPHQIKCWLTVFPEY